jgi:hypothetical protein
MEGGWRVGFKQRWKRKDRVVASANPNPDPMYRLTSNQAAFTNNSAMDARTLVHTSQLNKSLSDARRLLHSSTNATVVEDTRIEHAASNQ